ncbi:nuclear apoptosis-inducing factor 1 [Pelobates cultripes]|uniref:Nuclear apoptosis-inducing factor 1 n=1 Tax=Pelobates cultripes TaxID=61616 RepID=A0AAD1T711_PELCU|nr:nuclear apoptosis-inducing factor 1 [Pelobates cultripes]
MATPAKKRKMNFSEQEVEIIMEEMEKQKHVLINHFNAGVPLLTKSNAWQEILKRVNAISTCQRELAEVKKKWSDLKTDVRRKMSQARATMEGEGDGEPVVLTPMQQRICNLLGESSILSLPNHECPADISGQVAISSPGGVTLSQIPSETTYHTLEENVVEYCTTETPTTVGSETPVEIISPSPDVTLKPQELKNRIALNSARLLQEQRVTNLHVKEIAQHLEQQNDILQMIRRSQEVQASAQERQAQAMEGTQAALSALIQVLRPVMKDMRRYLQSCVNSSQDGGDVGNSETQNGQPHSINQ